MSNKHRTNSLHPICKSYLDNELGIKEECPKPSCSGTLNEVWVRYAQNQKPIRELECTTCGKIVRPHRKKKGRISQRVHRSNKSRSE